MFPPAGHDARDDNGMTAYKEGNDTGCLSSIFSRPDTQQVRPAGQGREQRAGAMAPRPQGIVLPVRRAFLRPDGPSRKGPSRAFLRGRHGKSALR